MQPRPSRSTASSTAERSIDNHKGQPVGTYGHCASISSQPITAAKTFFNDLTVTYLVALLRPLPKYGHFTSISPHLRSTQNPELKTQNFFNVALVLLRGNRYALRADPLATTIHQGAMPTPDKKSLTERDICTKFITPAVRQAGWDEMTQIREEVSFTKGRIIVRGKLVTRGKAKRADYILYYKPNIPLALIEAKDNNHSVGDGMQQALEYADDAQHPVRLLVQRRRLRLSRPDRPQRRQRKRNLSLDRLPLAGRALGEVSHLERPDRRRRSGRPAGLLRRRQRQGAALLPGQRRSTRTIEAIAKGQDRVLLVMATGTGKTYTAFQIIWRLVEGRPQETHPVPRRPQRPRRSDDGQRLPALRRRDGQAQHRRQDHRTRGRHRG